MQVTDNIRLQSWLSPTRVWHVSSKSCMSRVRSSSWYSIFSSILESSYNNQNGTDWVLEFYIKKVYKNVCSKNGHISLRRQFLAPTIMLGGSTMHVQRMVIYLCDMAILGTDIMFEMSTNNACSKNGHISLWQGNSWHPPLCLEWCLKNKTQSFTQKLKTVWSLFVIITNPGQI